MATAVELPEGYTQLEYIESGNGQYFNPNLGTGGRIVLDVEPLGTGCFYGTYQYKSWSASRKGWITNSVMQTTTGISGQAWRSGSSVISGSYINKRILLDFDFYAGVFSVDGTEKTLVLDTECRDINGYSLSPCYLLAQANGSSTSTSQTAGNQLHARLYGVKFYTYRGVLSRDYVPAINPSGTVGLYSTVGGTFISSASGTAFTAGPALAPSTVTVTLAASPTNGGSVSGGGTVDYNASVTVNATPASGYRFLRWTANGSTVSSNESYTFSATESVTLTAVFEAIPTYTVTLQADPANGGSVSGGGSYLDGTSVTVTASPGTDYTFSSWHEGSSQVSSSASYTFTLTANRTLIARFEKIEEPEPPEPPEPPGPDEPEKPTEPIETEEVSGFERRELYIDARDLQSDADEENPLSPEEYLKLLRNRGLEKLAENQLVKSFSAVVRMLNPTYVYGQDFFLGDIITVTDERLGVSADAVVQAVERSLSAEGERMELTLGYDTPTLYDILKRKAAK